MEKLKRAFVVAIALMFVILNCYNTAFAEGESFTCKISPSATEVDVGNEVSVTFAISSVTGFENGIMGIYAELDYDDDVLEYVSKENLNNWAVQLNGTKVVATYEPENTKDTKDYYVKTQSDVVKFTFKVKETTKEETTIKVKNISGSEDSVDIDSADVSTTIKIKSASTETPTTDDADKEELTAEVSYSTTESTTDPVTVTITANKKIKSVDGWTLSDDGTTLTKEYSVNAEETVKVTDEDGTTKEVSVKISNIESKTEEPTELTATVSYSTTKSTTGPVTATITANKKVSAVEGWTLSDDGKKLTKEYSENAEETVPVTDEDGTKKEVSVKITNIKSDATLKESITKLGVDKVVIPAVICLFVVIGTVSYINYRKYKNIK